MANAIEIELATLFLGGREIIHDLSLTVESGARCFILGANGAGKTTLIKMRLGYAWPLYGAKVSVLGNRFGSRYQKKAELAGGIILILIGVKILLEHLGLLPF